MKKSISIQMVNCTNIKDGRHFNKGVGIKGGHGTGRTAMNMILIGLPATTTFAEIKDNEKLKKNFWRANDYTRGKTVNLNLIA